MTAEKLLQHSRLPLAWHDQRTELGLEPDPNAKTTDISALHQMKDCCKARATDGLRLIPALALRNTHPAPRTNQIVQILRLDHPSTNERTSD
jgi:hypothetical protein